MRGNKRRLHGSGMNVATCAPNPRYSAQPPSGHASFKMSGHLAPHGGCTRCCVRGGVVPPPGWRFSSKRGPK